MALNDNGKAAIRRLIPFGDIANSIITKIDTPLSTFNTHERNLLRNTFGSETAAEIEAAVFFPGALQARTNRMCQILAGNQVIGQHIATEIGS
jgi:hypothetical protein